MQMHVPAGLISREAPQSHFVRPHTISPQQMYATNLTMVPTNFYVQQSGVHYNPLSSLSADSVKEEQLSNWKYLASPASSLAPSYLASPMMIQNPVLSPVYATPYGTWLPHESSFVYPFASNSTFTPNRIRKDTQTAGKSAQSSPKTLDPSAIPLAPVLEVPVIDPDSVQQPVSRTKTHRSASRKIRQTLASTENNDINSH
jgi:hypothetical protein